MKSINQIGLMITIVLSISFNCGIAQIKNVKTETVKVYGNCNMCKKNIETAAFNKKISSAVWDKESKTALLKYDSTQTTADAILKKIALAGYDNQNFLAPNDAYNKLDECCQYERKKPNPDVQATTHSTTTQKDIVIDTVADNPLEAIYNSYFALKNALTIDDGTTAAANAKELFNAIDKVKMESMTAAQHTVWMKFEKLISYDAEHIKGVTETEHQREHFASLSKNMIEVMKIIKPDYTVYIDHCPMYNDSKGADWLSKEGGIKNPYYGAMMLTCGKTTETIK